MIVLQNRQTCGLCTVSLYKKYTKEKTFVIFRGDHGLLGLQDGEDSAQDAYAHAGRRREYIRMNINICSIFDISASPLFFTLLTESGAEDAQQVQWADGAT